MALYDSRDTKTILRGYDFGAVVRNMAGNGSADIGFAREISADIEKRTGRVSKRGGLIVPDCVLRRAFSRSFAKATTAGHLVATENKDGDIISDLTATSVLGRAGIRTITGLRGDAHFPRGGSVAPTWVTDEFTAAEEKTPVYDGIKATPHTISCFTDVTRPVLVQTTPAAFDFVLAELARSIRTAIEKAAFSGTGEDGEPLGIDNATGINSLSFTAGAPTYAEAVSAWETLANENANPDALKWILPSAVKAKFMTSLDVRTAGDSPVAGGYLLKNGELAEAPVLCSNNATAKRAYLADWSQFVLCSWSGVEILRNPDTNGNSIRGGMTIIAIQDVDFVIRQAKAFGAGQVLA